MRELLFFFFFFFFFAFHAFVCLFCACKGQGSRRPIIGPVKSQKKSNCLSFRVVVVLNIFRLCSFMCDILFQDKALNKLVLNGQIRAG